MESGISEKQFDAMKKVDDVSVESAKKVSRYVAGLTELIKLLVEMFEKFELVRVRGKMQALVKAEKKAA